MRVVLGMLFEVGFFRYSWLLVLAMIAAGTFPISAAQAAQPSPDVVTAWEQRVIYTDEFGVDTPSGITVDHTSGIFFVIDSERKTIVGITPTERAAGEIFLSDLTDPLNVVVDAERDRVVMLTPAGVKTIPLVGGRPAAVLASPRLENPRGMAVNPTSGDIFLLDAKAPRLVRIDASGDLDSVTLRGLARFDLQVQPVDYPGTDQLGEAGAAPERRVRLDTLLLEVLH